MADSAAFRHEEEEKILVIFAGKALSLGSAVSACPAGSIRTASAADEVSFDASFRHPVNAAARTNSGTSHVFGLESFPSCRAEIPRIAYLSVICALPNEK